jgi:hypothetical protein
MALLAMALLAMAPPAFSGLPLPLGLALPVGASPVSTKSAALFPSLDPRGVSTLPGLSSPPALGAAPDWPAVSTGPEALSDATVTCRSSTEQALAQLAASIRIPSCLSNCTMSA